MSLKAISKLASWIRERTLGAWASRSQVKEDFLLKANGNALSEIPDPLERQKKNGLRAKAVKHTLILSVTASVSLLFFQNEL